jgi:hypothetical protein
MDDKNKSTVGSVLDKIRNGDANSTLEQVKVRYNKDERDLLSS